MANLFDSFGDWLGRKIAPYINDALGMRGLILGNYYSGDHRAQLKDKLGQGTSDNIVQNFVGLAVDRSVSRLFRGGVEFRLPEGATEQQEYINKVWDLNKKEIILFQVGLHGAIYGMGYCKISPDGIVDPFDGKPYPRLIALDPEIVRIKTDPQDMNEVWLYQISWKGKDANGREVSYIEITRRSDIQYNFDSNGQAIPSVRSEIPVEGEAQAEAALTWVVETWEQSPLYGNQRTLTGQIEWEYDFPPIHHWKNLPSLKSCYGDSDIDDAINVQDKSNFVISNMGKIIKFHAHPETIGTGFSVKDMQKLDAAVGSFHAIPIPEAKVYNLEMQSDLASSQQFALTLRQSIFDIAREVDISSMADKLGALTNFGLKVLWSDAIDKNDTKRQLYGDALKELNRRLLVLKGEEGPASNPGEIKWGEALPVNIKEEMETDQLALDMGIIDKETVAIRYKARYGKSFEDIQKALQKEQETANQNNADIGSLILRNFNQGKGAEMPQNMPRGQRMPMNAGTALANQQKG